MAPTRRQLMLSPPYYDLAILDMTLPRFSSGTAQIDRPTREGEELLEEIDVWNLPTRAIIFSGYENFRGGGDRDLVPIGELETKLRRSYPAFFLGWVFYSASSRAWRSRMEQLLELASSSITSARSRG